MQHVWRNHFKRRHLFGGNEETVSVKVLLVAKKQSLSELVPGRKGVNESLWKNLPGQR